MSRSWICFATLLLPSLLIGSPKLKRLSAQAPVAKEVAFAGAGGLTLKGTLLEPPGSGPFPALLLLPGSGPSDRDGNQGPLQTNVLKDIAYAVARRNIATLRFDKRAVAATYATSYPKSLPELDDFFTWENFVADAEDAYKFLKAQREIDPNRTGVLGHSEGGMIALAIAKDTSPKALVLVSTPARNLGDVIIDQIATGYSAQFADPQQLQIHVLEVKSIVRQIRDTGQVPNDVPAELKPLFPAYASKYLHSIFVFEPTSAAAEFHGKALVVQGEKDIQVSPVKDGPPLYKSFPAGVAEFYLAKACSHCLKHPTGPLDPGLVGITDAGSLQEIASWSANHL